MTYYNHENNVRSYIYIVTTSRRRKSRVDNTDVRYVSSIPAGSGHIHGVTFEVQSAEYLQTANRIMWRRIPLKFFSAFRAEENVLELYVISTRELDRTRNVFVKRSELLFSDVHRPFRKISILYFQTSRRRIIFHWGVKVRSLFS